MKFRKECRTNTSKGMSDRSVGGNVKRIIRSILQKDRREGSSGRIVGKDHREGSSGRILQRSSGEMLEGS